MVSSYCNMSYQQAMASGASSAHHHHAWYPQPATAAAAYHHPQGAQIPQTGYRMDAMEQQQMWAHPPTVHPSVAHHHFHGEFGDLTYANVMHNQGMEAAVPHQPMPSPTVTVSDMSSPGTSGGNLSPTNVPQTTRPAAVRSPYDWLKNKSYQQQPAPGKTRTKDKYRVVYSDHQRVELEKEFYYSRYITIRRKSELANNLGLSERQVKIWFQNRRAKERKQVKKREDLSIHKDNTLALIQQQQESQIQLHANQHHHMPLTNLI